MVDSSLFSFRSRFTIGDLFGVFVTVWFQFQFGYLVLHNSIPHPSPPFNLKHSVGSKGKKICHPHFLRSLHGIQGCLSNAPPQASPSQPCTGIVSILRQDRTCKVHPLSAECMKRPGLFQTVSVFHDLATMARKLVLIGKAKLNQGSSTPSTFGAYFIWQDVFLDDGP